MYAATVTLLMLVFPSLSVLIGALSTNNHAAVISLVGKWFVFWAIGIRLFIAGIRQIVKPGLTSEDILGIKGKQAWLLVRELGFANVSIGLVAIVSLWKPEWTSAAALAGGLFLLLAGVEHVFKQHRNFEENLAMYSDLFIALVMAVYLISRV